MTHPIVWFELASDDTAGAKRFYQEMFRWKIEDMDGYGMVKVNVAKEFGAGIKANPGRGHVPSHWAPFVGVEDVKTATKKAVKLGAKVIHDAQQTPWGIVSTVLDPTGAPLNLWQAKPEKK